ncbi:MAG: SIS domain-containing protein [Candidatus Thermoplasmatota archaeon]|jgi:D-sedoheptulose 7-phosphate isomerase|nr:SIS domain-containing protein [Candidatus Thermoplasmatota archaeon]
MDIEGIKKYLDEGSKVRDQLDPGKILYLGDSISHAFKTGHKIILFGNGGSAADAQHIAAEFVGRFEKERKPLPAMILHGNSSSITAIGNDYSYGDTFSRQVEAFAKPGDLIIALSTSGNSENVVRAVEAAKRIGCTLFGITGSKGGKLNELINDENLIKISSNRTSYIQESTIAIGHIVSKIVEDSI